MTHQGNTWGNVNTSKLKQLIMVIIASLFLYSCDNLGQEATVNTDSLLARAEAYMQQGQFRAALIEVRNTLQQDPQNIKANILMARLALTVGQTKSAISQLEQLKDVKDADYVFTLAEAYSNRGKYFSAKELLNENTQLASSHTGEFYLLASRASMGLKNPELAQQQADKAIAAAKGNSKLLAEALIQAAKLQVAQGNISKAQQLLDQSLEVKKTSEALVVKASIAFNEGNYETTEDLLSSALIEEPQTDIITPQRAKILGAMVQVLTKSGRSSEALIYSKLLAEARPDSQELQSRFQEAVELYKNKEFDKAEAILVEIYKTSPNDVVGRLLGIIKAMQGDLESADQYLSEHIDPETAPSEVIQLMVGTKAQLNQPQEILQLLREKVAQSPDDPKILSVYGMAQLNVGEVEEGIKTLEKTLEITPKDTKLSIVLANAYLKQGEQKRAEALLKQAYKLSPLNKDIALALNKYYLGTRQIEQAKVLNAEVLKNFEDKSFAHGLAGSLAMATQDFPKAIANFEKTNQLKPGIQEIEFALLKAYMENKDLEKAEALVTKLVDKEPNNSGYLKAMVTVAELKKAPEPALTQLDTMTDTDIQLWAPLAVLAEYHARQGNPSLAMEYAERMLARNAISDAPKNVALQVYNAAFRQGTAQGNLPIAREGLLNALQLLPNNVTLMSRLANIEIQEENYGEAQKLITQIEAAAPPAGLAEELKGNIALKKRDFSKAHEQFQASWMQTPTDGVANKIYLLKGETNDEPDQFLEEWIEKLPSSEQAITRKAMKLQSEGQDAKAIVWYRKALEVTPNALAPLNNLAWLLRESSPSESLQLAEKGASIYGNNAAMLDTFGWILLKTGNTQKAQAMLKRAHELAPDNPEIKKHYDQALNAG